MTKAECEVPDCRSETVARGWCRAHWRRWRLYGDPIHRQPRSRRDPAERFWPKVRKGEGCWEWQAYCEPRYGYGIFRMESDAPMWKAHRAAWTLTYGPIPDGLVICHRCDNSPCVRPDHLFLGSLSDNTQDALDKGRWNREPNHWGESSPNSKLTAEQVAEIRARYVPGLISQRELGEEYGVGQTQVGRIIRGVRWKQAT